VLKVLLAFAFFIITTLTGCSTNSESTNQVNDSAFLQLEGNFLNTQLSIDDEQSLELNSDSIKTLNGKEVARFPISTGKHTLKITRSGAVIVQRVIYVSNSNTFEVVVP